MDPDFDGSDMTRYVTNLYVKYPELVNMRRGFLEDIIAKAYSLVETDLIERVALKIAKTTADEVVKRLLAKPTDACVFLKQPPSPGDVGGDVFGECKRLAVTLNEKMASLVHADLRLSVISFVTDGYCERCGSLAVGGVCHCENDE